MMTQILRLLVIAVLALGVTANSAQAQPDQCRGTDFVTISMLLDNGTVRAVILSTRATLSWRGKHWRFRVLAVAGNRAVKHFSIVRGAVAGIVTYRDGSTTTVDLTRPITNLATAEVSRLVLPPALDVPSPCNVVEDTSALDAEMRAFLSDEGYLFRSGVEVQTLGSFNVEVVPLLYAPVLQFSDRERVEPSEFNIWKSLNSTIGVPAAPRFKIKDQRFRRFLREYQRIRDGACTVYHHRNSQHEQPGSWVVQFWLYYPFDIGGTGSHAHDSEHLFVEVDKLGGTVRRVVGAGHGDWAPNNIYTTYLDFSLPVELPLYAIVELGKHATAPDIDRDGFFTPGLDSNNDWDAAKVWGIRDTTGVTDSNLRAYSASMMADRDNAKRRIPSHFLKKTVPYIQDIAETSQKSCTFLPLPDIVGSSSLNKCPGNTPECAASQVMQHADFKDIRAALKPEIYPPRSIRFMFTGIATADEEGGSTERSGRLLPGFAIEFSQMRMPIPGRLAIDAYLEPGFDGLGVRYETMASNLFGYYAGFSFVNDDLKDFEPVPKEFDRKKWLTAGALFERAMPEVIAKGLGLHRRLTFNAQGGLMYNNFYRLTWDARLGFGITFRRPNSKFGITAATPNPY